MVLGDMVSNNDHRVRFEVDPMVVFDDKIAVCSDGEILRRKTYIGLDLLHEYN